MNVILDFLKLRRVRLDYVSPPICPPLISASGSGVFAVDIEGPSIPTGLAFTGQCDKFLTWDNYSGLVCMSLYQAADPGNPTGPSVLVRECVTAGSVSVSSPGWWTIAPVYANGQIGPQSEPVQVVFLGSPAELVVPVGCDIAGYVVFKNPDPTNRAGTYALVLSGDAGSFAIEILNSGACYRLQAITDRGISELSAPLCRNSETGCCPTQVCPTEYAWNFELCSCWPDPFSGILGPTENNCLNSPYFSYLEAVDAVGPCLWELVSGSVPTGLTLTTGLIPGTTTTLSGLPTAGGNFTFTVRCTDVYGVAKEGTFTVSILGIDQTSPLTDATTDTSYSNQLTASGGVPPYSFALAAGFSFPSGLSMTGAGLISGYPDFSGSYSFDIEVTDSNGQTCSSSFDLEVLSCPSVSVFPSIAGEGIDNLHCALDHQNRRLWIPDSVDRSLYTNPPNQIIRVINTANKVAGVATPVFLPNRDVPAIVDPLNLIDTTAKGDLKNSLGRTFIDTKNSVCIVGGNQGWNVAYDLVTQKAVRISKMPVGTWTQFLNHQPAYDASRGFAYMEGSNGILWVQIFNCDPFIFNANLADIYTQAGFTAAPDTFAYSPEADQLYIANVNGPNLYHKWDPVSHAFTTNLQAGYGAASAARYIRGLGFIVFQTAAGLVFIDPQNGDAVVGTSTYNAGRALYWVEGNLCNPNIFFVGSGTGGQRIEKFTYSDTPSPSFSHVTIGTGSNTYPCFAFDEDGGKLFAVIQGSPWNVETFGL